MSICVLNGYLPPKFFVMEFEIRQVTINDLEELAILFDRYRIFYGQTSDLEKASSFLFDRFEHGESVIFIAEDRKANKLAGFTQLYPIFSSVSMKRLWLLNDLFVEEIYRRQGIANRLLDAAKVFAVHTKAKGLELATAKDNYQAQKLYEKLGYVKDDEFFHYSLRV